MDRVDRVRAGVGGAVAKGWRTFGLLMIGWLALRRSGLVKRWHLNRGHSAYRW